MACAILMLALLQLTSMQRKRHWVSRDSQSSDFCATGSLGVDQIENNSQTANNGRNEKRKELEAQTSTSRAKLTVHVAHLEVPQGGLCVSEHCRGPCSVAVASSRSGPRPQQPSIYMHPYGHTRKSKTNTLQPQDGCDRRHPCCYNRTNKLGTRHHFSSSVCHDLGDTLQYCHLDRCNPEHTGSG